MQRRTLLLGLPLLLAGCGARSAVIWAPDDAVARYTYRNPGPTVLSLVTVKNEGTNSGAHTALLVAASERVLFDPAGGWTNPIIPERHDVLYGLSPEAEELYLDYQAQDGYYYVKQEKLVPPEVAEAALVRVKGYGPVRQTMCTMAVCDVLQPLPGFEGLGRTFFPNALEARFARLPGVVTTERHGPDAAAGPG